LKRALGSGTNALLLSPVDYALTIFVFCKNSSFGITQPIS